MSPRPSARTTIAVQGARVHNLKNVSLEIPRDRLIVVKGRVVHCSISEIDQELVMYRSGIEFVEAPDRVDDVIADFIDAVKSGRRDVV